MAVALELRLCEIAQIIEAVDSRCAAADGPVTPTLEEMTQGEISRIYALATHAPASKAVALEQAKARHDQVRGGK